MVKRTQDPERRRYIRLDSVFPVDFRLTTQDNQVFLSDWLQGFTNNISTGGICLSVNNLKSEFNELIKKGKINLLLNIQIPLSSQGVPARAKPVWIRPVSNQPGRYIIGLSYGEISAAGNRRIVNYARMKYFIPRISAGLLVILALSIGISGYFNWKLTKENRSLVSQLVKVVEDSKTAQDTINKINRDKQELNSLLARVRVQIEDAQKEKQELSQKLTQMEQAIESKELDERKLRQDTQQLALLINQLEGQRDSLQEKMLNLQRKETEATQDLLVLDQKKSVLQQATFDNMYQWLIRHQNPRTGLILSFEGDQDIANWAFTYDQALVACAYTYFADFKNAQKIFNFFNQRARKAGGAFLNAYYATDGEPAEYVVHCGPNIWLGIAIMQYTRISKDSRYLDLARKIADWTIQIQSQDKDGGIRGGPDVAWYATEHNLDAYAFFDMLYEITGAKRYKDSAGKVLGWLVKHSYDPPDVPIRRGKGDSTIATDTYAWSIAALGPQILENLGMRADDIINFAEDNCYVETNFSRPDGNTVRVRGFDFAAQRNLARGGIISCEWTAQMVLSFKILAEFYQNNSLPEIARVYQDKAQDYLWQLSRMIISSPSASGQGRGCLPYASSDFVDTGHGWMTPKGNSTGSVAATTYTLFAYYGWNPLQFSN